MLHLSALLICNCAVLLITYARTDVAIPNNEILEAGLIREQPGLSPHTSGVNTQSPRERHLYKPSRYSFDKRNVRHQEDSYYPPAESDDVLANVLDNVSKLHQDIVTAFLTRFPTMSHLREFLQSVTEEEDIHIHPLCLEHLISLIDGFFTGHMWALKMVDSWGKLPAGVLTLFTTFRGDYEECQKVVATFAPTSSPQSPTTTTSPPSTTTKALPSHPANIATAAPDTPTIPIKTTFSTPTASSAILLTPAQTPETTSSTRTTSTIEGKTSIPATNGRLPNTTATPFNQTNTASIKVGAKFYNTNFTQNGAVFVPLSTTTLYPKITLSSSRLSEKDNFDSWSSNPKLAFRKYGNPRRDTSDVKQRIEKDDVIFRGKFCRVGLSSYKVPGHMIAFPSFNMYIGLSLDVCVPDTCYAKDLTLLLNRTIETITFHFNPEELVVEESTCQEHLPWEVSTIVTMVLLIVGLLVLTLCTLYDLWYIQKPKWERQKMRDEVFAKGEEILNHIRIARTSDQQSLIYSPRWSGRHASGGRSEEDGMRESVSREVYDSMVLTEVEPTRLATIAQILSLYTNGSKLLSTDAPANTLTCVQGIRFLSICWLLLFHTMLYLIMVIENTVPFLLKMTQLWYTLVLGNGFLVVDTFFVMSGVMVGYWFHQIHDLPSKYRWVVYVIRRIVRLTPTLVVFGILFMGLWPQLGTGPNYPPQAPEEENCRANWPYTLFFINNIVGTDSICLSWTWYLSNDFQLYLASPLIMIPLIRGWRKLGLTLATGLVVAGIVTSGIVSYTYKLAESDLQIATAEGAASGADYFRVLYAKPYNRLVPYIVGLLVGYVLWKTDRKVQIPKYVVILGWLCSTGTALAVIFGTYPSYSGTQLMTLAQAAVYNALKHLAFGSSIAWVIFACVTGHGGAVNTILSWKPFLSLGRVTYSMYIIHPGILFLFAFSIPGLIKMSLAVLIVHFLGILVISTIAGYCISVAVEVPCIRAEKKILEKLGIKLSGG